MSTSYKTVFRLTMVATVITVLLFIDGIVLMATNGLQSDATNVFPVLGGSLGNATRTSGANIIIMAVIMAIVTVAGWVYTSRVKAAQQRAAAQPAAAASPSAATARHDG
jgi:uncharacterized membrane protein